MEKTTEMEETPVDTDEQIKAGPSKSQSILRVGLTGNIGSGKSTAAMMFTELGVPTFDADKAGHSLLESDEAIKSKVIKTFGTRILVGGRISRKNLGEIVFANPAKKKQLERILHPAIISVLNEKISSLPDSSYAVVEAALIYEAESKTSLTTQSLSRLTGT